VLVGLAATDRPAVDWEQPELMLRGAAMCSNERSARPTIGPGLGTGETARHLLGGALRLATPMVIDADALTLIAADATLVRGGGRAKRSDGRYRRIPPKRRACRRQDIGHPGEPDRSALTLAGGSTPASSSKGVGSVLAYPDGSGAIMASGNRGSPPAAPATYLPACSARCLRKDCSADAHAAGRMPARAAPPMRWSRKAWALGLTASELAPGRTPIAQHLTRRIARAAPCPRYGQQYGRAREVLRDSRFAMRLRGVLERHRSGAASLAELARPGPRENISSASS
jgi:hypothetical protein